MYNVVRFPHPHTTSRTWRRNPIMREYINMPYLNERPPVRNCSGLPKNFYSYFSLLFFLLPSTFFLASRSTGRLSPPLPLRFSPIPSILLRNERVRNEPPVLSCIKSLESGKPIVGAEGARPHQCVITLASNENPPGASPRALTCRVGTCS
jgi:hypothetical protein